VRVLIKFVDQAINFELYRNCQLSSWSFVPSDSVPEADGLSRPPAFTYAKLLRFVRRFDHLMSLSPKIGPFVHFNMIIFIYRPIPFMRWSELKPDLVGRPCALFTWSCDWNYGLMYGFMSVDSKSNYSEIN